VTLIPPLPLRPSPALMLSVHLRHLLVQLALYPVRKESSTWVAGCQSKATVPRSGS